MATLIVSADARLDLASIDTYLTAEAGQTTAQAYAARFADTLRRLQIWPGSGPPRPALGANARIAIVRPFLIIYDHERDADAVTVLRVVHGRQRITEALLRR